LPPHEDVTIINPAIKTLPEPEYRADARWSVSQFKLLPRHPELFRGRYITREFEFDPTVGMLFGTACHAEFLEGKQCRAIPPDVLTTNGQRRGKRWELYKESASSLECLNAKEIAAVRGIRASIDSQPRVANLLWGDGPTELSIFADDDETGLKLKGRLDKLRSMADGRVIVDLKITALDPDDPRKIAAQALDMAYHQQMAFYADLVEAAFGDPAAGVVMIFCRAKPPYTARAWIFNDNDIELGRRRNRLALLDLRRRLDSGSWTGDRHNELNAGPEGMLLPRWAYTDDPGDNPPAAYEEFSAYAGDD
jgi:hypothetical protein